MKQRFNPSFLIILLLSVFLISSCEEGGGDGGGTPTPEPDDPLDAQAALLNGNWSVKDVNSVTKDGTITSRAELRYGLPLVLGLFRMEIKINSLEVTVFLLVYLSLRQH